MLYSYAVFRLGDSDPDFIGEMDFPVPIQPGNRIDLSHRLEPEFADRKWWIVDRVTVYPHSDTTAPILQEQTPVFFVRPIV